MNRRAAAIVLCSIFVTAFGGVARAQTYPTHPVALVVPFPPGGSTDIVARILAQYMTKVLGQSVIVENLSGAGGSIGLGRVAHAAPDGYTLVVSNWTSHIGAPLLYPVQFDIEKDFEPVARLTQVPLMIIGSPKFAPNDLRSAIEWLRANPERGAAATVGPGSAAHLCMADFQAKTGTHLKPVPYRGNAPAVQDVMGGQVEMMCGEASGMLPFVRSGAVKAYAVMKASRWFAAPEIPTSAEAGVPGAEIAFWHGLWAPKGTPKEIVARLGRIVSAAFADPEVIARLHAAGHEIPTPEQQKPAALTTFVRQEMDKWWPMIRAENSPK